MPILPKGVFRARHSERGPWYRFLPLDESAELVQIDRGISVDGEFSVLSRLFAAADPYVSLLYVPLSEQDDAHFDREFRDVFGVSITSVSLDSSCTRFPDKISKALALPRETDELVLHSVAKNVAAMPNYYEKIYISPNGRRLHIADRKVGPTV